MSHSSGLFSFRGRLEPGRSRRGRAEESTNALRRAKEDPDPQQTQIDEAATEVWSVRSNEHCVAAVDDAPACATRPIDESIRDAGCHRV